jgi:hypothetical protein
MCISLRQMDSKSRIFMAIGNLCLTIGLTLRLFVHPSGQAAKNWLEGVSGLLVGISIGTNFFGLRHMRRNQMTGPDGL